MNSYLNLFYSALRHLIQRSSAIFIVLGPKISRYAVFDEGTILKLQKINYNYDENDLCSQVMSVDYQHTVDILIAFDTEETHNYLQ